MDTLVKHFRGLFEYEIGCTPLVHESLAQARESIKRSGLAALAAPYERAVQVWAHTQAARRIWLVRLGETIEAPSDGLFPVWPLERAHREANEMDRVWLEYISRLDEQELARVTRYTSTEGKGYDTDVRDILTHVVNHSTYHRGQIASLVAATGTKPAITDFVFFRRREV